jgi:hypothetical protein
VCALRETADLTQEILEVVERAEDAEDLRALEAMRRKPIRFRKLDDVLKSYVPDA